MDPTLDPTTLDKKYQGTIESHKAYLAQLQAAFDKHCDQIGDEAKAKLAQTPEEDEEARKKIMEDEQAQLSKALAELKQVVNQTNRAVYKKLEEIENKRSEMGLNLDEELAQVENPKKTK
jgi:multidrug efflux pump subunit AcrA (membrane-fusion protein)